jgi:uncharacterized protein
MEMKSYLSPKTDVRKSTIHGKGLFAKKMIKKGEIVSVKCGHVMDGKMLAQFSDFKNSELQIETDLFLAPRSKNERAACMMYLNHSCDPNIGIEGNIIFVAMRNIASGEELTMDYAMFDDAGSYHIRCSCQSKECRKVINGGEWKNVKLQKKYRGYFSTFIQKKIDAKRSK